MVDDRNLTSHTYIEELADAIFRRLPSYLSVMSNLLRRIQDRVGEG